MESIITYGKLSKYYGKIVWCETFDDSGWYKVGADKLFDVNNNDVFIPFDFIKHNIWTVSLTNDEDRTYEEELVYESERN